MKTLADFKRALKIGSMWEGFNHYYKTSLGIREVSKVQSNSFAFKTIKEGVESNSWANFPKAKDIQFKDDGTVDIYTQWCGKYILMLSYKKIGG